MVENEEEEKNGAYSFLFEILRLHPCGFAEGKKIPSRRKLSFFFFSFLVLSFLRCFVLAELEIFWCGLKAVEEANIRRRRFS